MCLSAASAEARIRHDMDQREAASEVAPRRGTARTQALASGVPHALQARAAAGLAAQLAAAVEGVDQGLGQGSEQGVGLGYKHADALMGAVAAALACGIALFRGAGEAVRLRLDACWGDGSALAGALPAPLDLHILHMPPPEDAI